MDDVSTFRLRRDGVACSDLGSEIVILDLDTSSYYSASNSAATLVGALVCALLAARGASETDASTQLAYIGPGAGLALMGSAFAILIAILSALATIILYPFMLLWWFIRGRKRYAKAKVKRVVVLLIDGNPKFFRRKPQYIGQ